MSIRSAVLFFKEGTSDKTYQLQIEEAAGGYVVNFQFGRTGQTLQPGTKTKAPVTLAEAEKVFTDLLKEKTAKGYQIAGVSSAPAKAYQNPVTEKIDSGLLPQLLNPIEEAEAARLLQNDAWFLQEKADGKHQMARIARGIVTGSNRKGQVVPLPKAVEKALAFFFPDGGVVDGEMVGEKFVAFDLLEAGGEDLRESPADERYIKLASRLTHTAGDAVTVVRTAIGTVAKRKLFDAIRSERGEGVVFKKFDAKYRPGRPNTGGSMLKLKFVATATCVVLGQNGSKSSVILGMENGGLPQLQVGKVTIPPNATVPPTGALVEVRYLYAYAGGSMVQTVYLRVRDDVDRADEYSTLKFKQGHEQEDAPGPEEEEEVKKSDRKNVKQQPVKKEQPKQESKSERGFEGTPYKKGKPTPEVKPEPQPEPKPKVDTTANIAEAAKAVAEAAKKPGRKPKAEAPKPEPKPEVTPEVKPEPAPEPKAEPKAKPPKSEPKVFDRTAAAKKAWETIRAKRAAAEAAKTTAA